MSSLYRVLLEMVKEVFVVMRCHYEHLHLVGGTWQIGQGLLTNSNTYIISYKINSEICFLACSIDTYVCHSLYG